MLRSPLFGLGLSILFYASPASAEVMQLECSFDFSCVKEGECGSSKFEMRFSLDTVTEEAFAVGSGGLSPVRFLSGYGAFSFVEELDSGAVQTTTIAEGGRAVHSRNTVIAGMIANSQYLGKCRRS